jgi:ribosomal protein S18 acetylase RimI-like enzyme
MALLIRPAGPDEWPEALRLLFQHLPPGDRDSRVAEALRLLRGAEFDPAGLLLARRGRDLAGAVICATMAGAGGMVWPPQAVLGPDASEVEDELLRAATAWLRGQGTKLAQTLLAPQESALAGPLERGGFCRVTTLWFFRRELSSLWPLPAVPRRLSFQTYAEADRDVFHRALLRTYEGTLDCPEINGVRDVHEIVVGHQAQGAFDPGRWWLAWKEGRPAGVLLLNDLKDVPAWDLSYLGVIPDARRRGVGRELACKALEQARAHGALQLTLSVDVRNRPAWQLYTSLGFRQVEPRDVYLAVWGGSGAGGAAAHGRGG